MLRLLPFAALVLPLAAGAAFAAEPIRIGVIAENSAISGIAIPNAAMIAADEINAAGGIDGRKIEIIAYDDHNSAADAVRALQRLASQDKVEAVIATYTSEVALALEPWAGRLKLPIITPGAASDEITKRVHENYAALKYVFQGYFASSFLSQSVCDSAKDLLVDQFHMKTAAIFSEDAAWTVPLDATYEACLPKAGLKVLDTIRMSPDTTDFTPIYNGLEAKKPDVLIAGISHVGVQPVTQWASQQVPIPMYGVVSQATSTTFWKDTNGATDGVVLQNMAVETVPTTAEDRAVRDRPTSSVSASRQPIRAMEPMTRSTISPTRSTGPAATTPTSSWMHSKRPSGIGTVGHDQVLRQGRGAHAHGLIYGPGDGQRALIIQWQNGKHGGGLAEDGGGRQHAQVPVLHQDRRTDSAGGQSGPRRGLPPGRPSRFIVRPPAWCAVSDMLTLQILIDGFAISALYGLGAVGFHADLRRVRRPQPQSHGGLMVAAATVAWVAAERVGAYGGRPCRPREPPSLLAFVDLRGGGPADPAVARSIPPEETETLRPHRDAALGNHDPGGDRLSRDDHESRIPCGP